MADEQPPATPVTPQPEKKGRKLLKWGCLSLVGFLIVIAIITAILAPSKEEMAADTAAREEQSRVKDSTRRATEEIARAKKQAEWEALPKKTRDSILAVSRKDSIQRVRDVQATQKAHASTSSSGSLGISRDAITSDFEQSSIGFTFKEGRLTNGDAKYTGTSNIITGGIIEVLGPASAPNNASCIVIFQKGNDNQAKLNLMLLSAFARKFDDDASDWVLKVVNDAIDGNQLAESFKKSDMFGGNRFTMEFMPSIGSVMLTVEPQ